MPQWLTELDCRHILQSLLSAELSAYRGTPEGDLPDPATIDSLERLHLAACVNEFFCLHETGSEDRLLMTTSLDEWASLVAEATAHTSGLTFRTSGSTGTPTAHLHLWRQIEAEVESLAECCAAVMPIHRVISWLPLHHLYGFMLGIAFPAIRAIPRVSVTHAILPELCSGDMLVTVPPRWNYLARSRSNWPAHLIGVSSTGLLSADTAVALQACGVKALLQIYGSTESGGIATRWQPDAPYQLLTHWQRVDSGLIARHQDDMHIALQDEVQWLAPRSFLLKGRLDDVVSIGGVNVSLRYVRQRLMQLSSVADCAIRVSAEAPQQRLKAFVVPAATAQQTAEHIAQLILQWPAAERPVHITYGDTLPTNSMGKAVDW